MPVKLTPATPADAPALAALRAVVAQDMTAKFGKGYWSSSGTEKGVFFDMKTGTIYVARQQGKLIAMLRLSTRKPWAIDRSYFTPCQRPLYLTGMAVAPELQRGGIGRLCLDEAVKIARAWPADAILLDAWDADTAGAGEFYRKCGFREVARVTYRAAPLIYYELLLPAS